MGEEGKTDKEGDFPAVIMIFTFIFLVPEHLYWEVLASV